MSTTNPRVTSDGALITDTDWVRYPCASCDEEIRKPQWPDTLTPRCDACMRSVQKQADVQTLHDMLNAEDHGEFDPIPAMARLVVSLVAQSRTTARDVAELQNTWAAKLTDAATD